MQLFDLSNKTAVVTGGYGHLGNAIVRGLTSCGATVFVAARSTDRFAMEFDCTPNIAFLPCDVNSTASVQQALTRMIGAGATPDILINNAFSAVDGSPLETNDLNFTATIDGALGSVYRVIREFSPSMIARGAGKIINMGSMYGLVSPDFSVYQTAPAYTSSPAYGAAKAGVIQLTRYLAWQLGPNNIQVNCISPGPFPNPDVQQNEAFIEALATKTALKRIGSPEEIAGAVVFLASKSADYVTGHNLIVDGGWTSA